MPNVIKEKMPDARPIAVTGSMVDVDQFVEIKVEWLVHVTRTLNLRGLKFSVRDLVTSCAACHVCPRLSAASETCRPLRGSNVPLFRWPVVSGTGSTQRNENQPFPNMV